MEEKLYFEKLNEYYVKDGDARESITDLNSSVSNLDDQINNVSTGLKTQIETLDTEINDASTGLNAKVNSLDDQINDSGTGLDDRVSTLESSVKGNGLKVGIPYDYTIQATGELETIPVSVIDSYSGTSLTIDNGKIKIGANVHHILVSGSIYFYSPVTTETVKTGMIQYGGHIGCKHNLYCSAEYTHLSLPATLLNVTENELIELNVVGEAEDVIRSDNGGTFLNVIVLD